MANDHLDEVRKSERRRRTAEAALAHREHVRGEVRLAIGQCEEFSTPGPLSVPPEHLSRWAEWCSEPAQVEREGRLRPHAEDWPKYNVAFCAAWIERWKELSAALTESGDSEYVAALVPDEPRMKAMHGLFVRLLGAAPSKTLLKDLAKLRASLESDSAEVRRHKGSRAGARFELRHYFSWIRLSLGGRWSPGPPKPEPLLLPYQAQCFCDLLLERSPDKPITGPRICQAYLERHRSAVEESDFRTNVVPKLKALGLRNKPRVGYYFPADAIARRTRAT